MGATCLLCPQVPAPIVSSLSLISNTTLTSTIDFRQRYQEAIYWGCGTPASPYNYAPDSKQFSLAVLLCKRAFSYLNISPHVFLLQAVFQGTKTLLLACHEVLHSTVATAVHASSLRESYIAYIEVNCQNSATYIHKDAYK